jgi:CRISPR-associated protein Csy1
MDQNRLSTEIAAYIQARASARLEKFDKDADKQRKELAGDDAALAEFNSGLPLKRADEEARFNPSVWLTDAAERAKQISMVTHSLKFTHTDAKGSSVYVRRPSTPGPLESGYLSTVALLEPRIDVVGNAAALDVASLLQIEDSGHTLISRLVQGDGSALTPFAENDAQLLEWVSGLNAVLADKELSSHKLAKQLYFPVAKDRYHLISPLYASSLSEALYKRVADSRYLDAAKATRKARKESRYSAAVTVDYPNIAVQTFGGTKPQNVSQLNSSRGGKSFLLSCQPPVWGKRVLPPANHKNSFWREYDRRAWRTAKALKDYLIQLLEKASTRPRRDKRAELVDELIGILLQYAAEVQSLKEHAGWSADSQLPLAQQLWLDPLRDDPEFQRLRDAQDWQQDVADQFANWLNHKLKDDKLMLKDVEFQEWSRLVERKLALLREDMEVLAS